MLSSLRRDAAPLAALDDDLRLQMYLFIRRRGRPVSRDEAAAEVGISRKLAAFHLDKLVDRGLLMATYARPPGRGGRGAGRSSKLYEPSDLEIAVSIPERRYDLIGSIFVRAIERQGPGESAKDAARRAARETGLELGRDIRKELGLRPPGRERAMAVTEEVLEANGYEPYLAADGRLALRSCPFHALAERARELVCGLNHAFIDGLVRGLGNETLDVAFEPTPGECCVKLGLPSERR